VDNLCKTCGETNPKNFYKQKWICKGCWNRMTYNRSRAKLDQLIAERGGRCECCGYNKCKEALQWHHIDPDVKEFSISSNRGSNIEKLRAETAKCQLLCANCHAETHVAMPSNPTARSRAAAVVGGPSEN
jgi:hypothetical protein